MGDVPYYATASRLTKHCALAHARLSSAEHARATVVFPKFSRSTGSQPATAAPDRQRSERRRQPNPAHDRQSADRRAVHSPGSRSQVAVVSLQVPRIRAADGSGPRTLCGGRWGSGR